MPKKSPLFPGPMTARGAVLAVLLSNDDQAGAEPMRGRITLHAIVRALKRKYHWPIETALLRKSGSTSVAPAGLVA